VYLKCLELTGFKSFAGKTVLNFEPGMTCIVGPNGCGKSNVSDAVRWVLGEQSAKALRGSTMEDCIFNGTDERKPLAMAEVAITFADCEETLGTEYHEVTVARRVFRSGEGQYFLNKTPCRLKDIQRLFMDTGIGTASYSVLEQGRIDQVLSSRAEDRRTIFEEASGITKYKSDRKEAIRKLEQTETNLLRLADVVREVKRQIGSLQRQAGKARRYKVLREELRKLDIFATGKRLETMDSAMRDIESQTTGLQKKISAAQSEIDELEQGNAVLRRSIVDTEHEIGSGLESVVQAQSKLDHTHELIAVNKQRIEEYSSWSERDSREIDEAGMQIAEKQEQAETLSRQLVDANAQQESAQQELAECNDDFQKSQDHMDSARSRIRKLREESIELESLASRLHNQLVESESNERVSVIQRERLTAEKTQLARVVVDFDASQSEMAGTIGELQKGVAASEETLAGIEQKRAAAAAELTGVGRKCSELRSLAAGARARIELLSGGTETEDEPPASSRLLLEESNLLDLDRSKILGLLSSHLDVAPGYRVAVEAAIRTWLDAVVVSEWDVAIEALRRLETRRDGPARLLALAPPGAGADVRPDDGADRLSDHVTCSDEIAPLVRRLLGNVVVVDSIESIPATFPPGTAFVTRGGSLVRGDGCMEFWMPGLEGPALQSRKELLDEARQSIAAIEAEIGEHSSAEASMHERRASLDAQAAEARTDLERRRRALALKEGESEVLSREAAEARDRLETVTWEFENLAGTEDTGESMRKEITGRTAELREQRERIASEINNGTKDLRQLEVRHAKLQSDVTEHRIRFAQLTQKVEHTKAQHEAVTARLQELKAAVSGRSTAIVSYKTAMDRLSEETRGAAGMLSSLEEAARENSSRVENLRKNRQKQTEEQGKIEAVLAEKRRSIEELRESKSTLDVQSAESRMRRQNLVDRVTSEHGITSEQLDTEPDPEWEGVAPSLDTVETNVAELRAKIEGMGPVNLVAIEEYKELEERYGFLTGQEQDLVKSKQHLMDVIRRINRTTSEMFRTTFEDVNTNFQTMFHKLFNGGSAKLVLVNEEDVLECGIEIIARPPGKRLQNISLLSGGERTLTAVALLFAIYMTRPSPFCLLDELDAALDDSNIGRFVGILQGFLGQSQFVVITHNRQTISAASVLYGVTMPEKGISKIVSMRFHEHEGQPAPAEVGAK